MLKEAIARMLSNSCNFLVVGDIMLDQYCHGYINRISPEAPVPVLKYKEEEKVLGGAANVAMNLKGMNQNVSLMSCVGNDAPGRELFELLSEKGISTDMIMIEDGRVTTTKTRFIAGRQQLLRVDDECCRDLSKQTQQRLLDLYKDNIEKYDVILLSDYMKGVLSYDFTKQIIGIAREYNKKVIIDVKDQNVEKYEGAYLLKPNRKELGDLTGMPVANMKEVESSMKTLLDNAKVQGVLTTLSDEGMAFIGKEGNLVKEKGDSRKVYDVVGAGDTAFAYIAVAIAYQLTVSEMLKFANTAALIKITKFGTSVVTLREVQEELYYKIDKIQTIDTIGQVLDGQRQKKIVFTNGCFDILHIGHVKYLKQAKAKGDILVVGVNSDASVKRLKGESRPINNQQDRIDILAEMEFVDYVVIFEDDTPYELIKKVKPDILVKGGDYQIEDIVGADFVHSIGGCVETIPFVEGKSTTRIIEAMREKQYK